jgi:hypothetical protein
MASSNGNVRPRLDTSIPWFHNDKAASLFHSKSLQISLFLCLVWSLNFIPKFTISGSIIHFMCAWWCLVSLHCERVTTFEICSSHRLFFSLIDFFLVLSLLSSNLVPIKHCGTIGIERAYLQYALSNSLTVDFGSLFCGVLVDRFGSLAKKKHGLSNTCLITRWA